MHPFIPHHLTAIHLFLLLLQYGYILLFPIAVIEGPVAAIVAGALVASNALNAGITFVLLVVADLLGDLLYYSCGRWGRISIIQQISSALGLNDSRLEPLKAEFTKNDWKFLLIGKTQAIGGIILYFAGVSKMRLEKFMMWNFIGTIPKVFVFMAIGYLFGQTLIRSQHYVDLLTISTFVLALLLLAGYGFFKYFVERNVSGTFPHDPTS